MNNKNSKDDDYLVTSKYAGRGRSEIHPNFSTFEYEGEYYFALLDSDDAVALRSEGYTTTHARDNGIASVKKNMPIEDRWSISEFMNRYFICLKAGNNQEIAKSGSFNSMSEAEAYLTRIRAGIESGLSKDSVSGIGIAGAAITGKIISETRKKINENRTILNETRKDLGEKSRSQIGETRNQLSETRNEIGENRRVLGISQMAIKADDYLPCDEYRNHEVTDEENNVALFKHDNGQLYFAIYNDDGSVRLRSEGFQSSEAREGELKDALKFLNDDSKYESIEKGEYHVNVLKNEAGQEVGRTCIQSGAGGYAGMAMAAVAAMTKTEFEAPGKKPLLAAGGTNDGCLRFWPLLLLLPLLYFCWKGCGTPPVPPPPPPPVPSPLDTTIINKDSIEINQDSTEVEKPIPLAVTCNCSDLTHSVFVLPEGPATREINVLGVDPEYGSLESLDEPLFYDMLKRKFDSSDSEKQFLNGIFKQMGYENGFADATADLISLVQLPNNVSGNMGNKSTHVTVYRKLNVPEKDRWAFRIKAKNACDLHFLKKCGNHFFYNECKD